jgi:GDP-L-fucose synthase
VKKVVAMGSAAMYSDNLNQPMSESDALGGEPHGSEFAYAFAKRALLVQLMSYRQQFGIEYAFAIATNMYGPGDRFNTAYGHVVPSLLRKFIDARDTGDLVEVWGDGSPTRDFLYAVDAARALDLLMTHGSGTYNVASGTVHTIGDLVRSVASSFPTVKYYWNKDRPMGQMVRSYDISRLKALGFKPEYSLDEGIRETVNWLEKNRENLRQ